MSNFHSEKGYINYVISNMYKLLKAKKYNQVIKLSSEHLKKYPNEKFVRYMRYRAYRMTNQYEKAIEDLKYSIRLNSIPISELYMLYYFLNMYDEAIKLLPIVKEEKYLEKHYISVSEWVIKKQLGDNIIFEKGVNYDYIKYQILNYNSKKALMHIKCHKEGSSDKNKSFFNTNVNIEYLFDFITQNLNKCKKDDSLKNVLDMYYFCIANIGYDLKNSCNLLKVVVIPNTNNIVSMYPIYSEHFNFISELPFDYNKVFINEKTKVKSISQIDKFNKRYK